MGGLSSFLYFLIRLLGFGEIYGSRFLSPKKYNRSSCFWSQTYQQDRRRKTNNNNTTLFEQLLQWRSWYIKMILGIASYRKTITSVFGTSMFVFTHSLKLSPAHKRFQNAWEVNQSHWGEQANGLSWAHRAKEGVPYLVPDKTRAWAETG